MNFEIAQPNNHHHVETAYLHALEGRLRINVPGVKGSPRMAADVEGLLTSLRGVDAAEANPRTGNVLVYYDSSRLTQGELIEALQDAGLFRAGRRQPALTASTNGTNDTLAHIIFRASFEFALQRLITVLI
jgi:copper chaperone CopZ